MTKRGVFLFRSTTIIAALLLFIMSTLSCFAEKKDEINDYLKNLASKDIEQRENALEKLISMGDEVVPIMIGEIQRGDRLTKMDAAWALGIIGNRLAVLPLLDNLHDKDISVVRYSSHALGMVGGDEAVNGLIKIIKDEEMRRVWNYAVMALGDIGDKKADGELQKLLNNKSVFIRFSAKRALQKIRRRSTNNKQLR